MSFTSHYNWQLTQVVMARVIVRLVADLFVHVKTSVHGDVCMRLISSSPFVQHVKKDMQL